MYPITRTESEKSGTPPSILVLGFMNKLLLLIESDHDGLELYFLESIHKSSWWYLRRRRALSLAKKEKKGKFAHPK